MNKDIQLSICQVALFTIGCIYLVNLTKPEIIKPIPEVYAVEVTPTPTPEPTVENIVSYIAKVFRPEGTSVVVKAIDCFYSESGLRTEAYNWNPKSNTEDRGVAQINSVHKLTPEQAHNFIKNIDKAYEIYKSRGNFSAWYGKGCN